MKYKVGDIVKIKEGLTPEKTNCFVPTMTQYCGKVAKIVRVNSNSYHLDIDDEEWYWYEDMLEPANPKKYEITVEGNTITVKDDNGNEGIAKCSPEDEFDLYTGISLAIDKLKWKPKEDEDFWTVTFSNNSNVTLHVWCNDLIDKELYKKGLVFKTEEEAKKVADTMLKVIER